MLSAWPGGLVRGQAPLEVRELTCQEGREIAFLHTDTLHTRCSGPAHWGGGDTRPGIVWSEPRTREGSCSARLRLTGRVRPTRAGVVWGVGKVR
jgi:hypothetical protein